VCNACGQRCCASGRFSQCGCNDCDVPECWELCEQCGAPVAYCECDPWDFVEDDAELASEPSGEPPDFEAEAAAWASSDDIDEIPDWWQDI
jgi:hypothetical protein